MTRRTRLAIAIQNVLVVMLCAAPSSAQDVRAEQTADGIHWCASLDEARELSKQDGKPVIAFFTFNTCHWCHKLEEDTFTDASVIEMSRSFHWVTINRDVTPELCERFNMSAYPSLITFGNDLEKVDRFSSYMLPEEFKENLRDALRRYDLYKAGQEWDDPEPRPNRITDDDGVTIETFKAPAEEVPAGFAFLGDSMWIAQMGSLFECDLQGKVKRTFSLDGSVLDICTDGTNLYAMTSGWTAGLPIYVIDPATGKTLRSIVTESNKANKSYGAKGIEFINGSLCVLEGMNGIIHTVDPQSGVITRTLKTQDTWLTGLAWDGQHYICGSKDRLSFYDDTGARVKSIAVNYPLRSVGWRSGGEKGAGAAYVMEQPIFDFGKQNERIRLWPTETRVYELSIETPAERRIP